MSDDIITKSIGVRLDVDDAQWKMRSDGLSVRGRIMPFGEIATVFERGEKFRERFLPGCITFMCQKARQRGNASWISLNVEHDETMDGRIGYASTIEQLPDGGWCDFRLLPSAHLDKARAMLAESHRGLSVMFDDIRPPQIDGDIRSRTQVLIRHVAATPWPVYDGALISSVRDATSAPDLDELADRPALAEWQAYLDTLHPTV